MSKTIVDSSIVIDYLRGREPALRYLEALQETEQLATHVVVVGEVLSGARNAREQKAIFDSMRQFELRALSEQDCMMALSFLEERRLSHGVEFHDCLNAATCLRLSLPIATLNDKHFRAFDGISVSRPY